MTMCETVNSIMPSTYPRPTGFLIINADDWGRDRETTDRISDCIASGAVSSASAMVFMEDSERAAMMSQERGIDAGLHLNFTTPYSSPDCPALVQARQCELAIYLRKHPLARLLFHPGLVRAFDYVVKAQLDEYRRLYQNEPHRLDGHHHMHLCSNVLIQRLLPPGTLVRRNFSFQPGEKSAVNRYYRRLVDSILGRRHVLVDFLFSLPPLEPAERLRRMFSLARRFSVEVETHPIKAEEYRLLTQGEVFRLADGLPIASRFAIPPCGRAHADRPTVP